MAKIRGLLGAAFFIIAAAAWYGGAPAADAHPFMYAAVHTNLFAHGTTIDLQTDVPASLSSATSSSETPLSMFSAYFNENLHIAVQGEPCAFALTKFDPVSSSTKTFFEGSFTCPHEIGNVNDITIHSALFTDFFQNFDHFITLTTATGQFAFAFSPEHQDYPGTVEAVNVYEVAGSSSAAAANNAPSDFLHAFGSVAAQFLKLGVLHIFTGFDHILFIVSIILLVRSLKDILLLVTSFTIAHSITLILAGLHIITLSPRLVEPMIALTIAYVAGRNIWSLWKRNEGERIKERGATTFGFGLIHGLGFAGALTQSGVPQAFFIPALLIFNVGIEVGQLAILAAVIPLIYLTDRTPVRRLILLILCGAIFLLAYFWFFERLL